MTDLDAALSALPDWFRELTLDLEAGRLNPDQAAARMRQRGVVVLDTIRRLGGIEVCDDAPAPRAFATHNGMIDPLAAWHALPPELQQHIGAAAIAIAVGDIGVTIAIEQADPRSHGPFQNASTEALGVLHDLVAIHVLGGDVSELPPLPDLRPLDVRQCRACGCTDGFACDNGCSWVEADLCSACTGEPR